MFSKESLGLLGVLVALGKEFQLIEKSYFQSIDKKSRTTEKNFPTIFEVFPSK